MEASLTIKFGEIRRKRIDYIELIALDYVLGHANS